MQRALLLVSLALVAVLLGCRKNGPPATEQRPVVDVYFGIRVTDPYRWLEDWSRPEVRTWSERQNAHARQALDNLPGREALRARVAQLLGDHSPSYHELKYRGETLFALEARPPRQQPFLVALRSPDDLASERVLLDPSVLDPSGATTIDFYQPSNDGRLVAVSLSAGGTESGSVRVVETATGRVLPDLVPRVNGGTAGGSVAWNQDGTAFYHTRYPAPGERPAADLDFFQQVYLHRLGTSADADTYVLGRELPRIAEIELSSSRDGRTLLVSVANGDGGEHEHFVLPPGGSWVQVTRFEDGVVQASLGPEGGLYLLSRKDAPRGKLLRLQLEAPRLEQAETLVPEGEPAIDWFRVTRGKLYVVDVLGGPSQVRVFDLAGNAQGTVPIIPVSNVDGIVALEGDEVLLHNESDLVAPAWYRYVSGATVRTALAQTSRADFSNYEALRETATSRDGTRVPLTILRRRGTQLNRENPTLLTGYGGFGVSLGPSFSPRNLVWLEQGGVLVVANLRGGGELGEAWHAAGRGVHKQNVFDDFIATARFLVASGYTRPGRLAILGGSNGGLLVGAALVQQPSLFRAVVAHVGLFDMLRFERLPNGVFNVTEYGTVTREEDFRALHAYSPYQHVVDGARYPACLFLTGANDPRVDPANSRKMVARLQAATRSGLPVLLRTSSGTGHVGSPLAERIAQVTDQYGFLFHQLGVSYRPVPGAAR